MHPLRKMTNSYYAIKRLLDRADTPHRVKAVLFDSYIGSKWQWCGSVIWPTVRSMKSIEGLKNSLLRVFSGFRGILSVHGLKMCKGAEGLLMYIASTLRVPDGRLRG